MKATVENARQLIKDLEPIEWENETGYFRGCWSAQFSLEDNGQVTVKLFVDGCYVTDLNLNGENCTFFLGEDEVELESQWYDVQYEILQNLGRYGYKGA